MADLLLFRMLCVVCGCYETKNQSRACSVTLPIFDRKKFKIVIYWSHPLPSMGKPHKDVKITKISQPSHIYTFTLPIFSTDKSSKDG